MEDKKNKKCFIMMPISDAEGYDKGTLRECMNIL